MQLKKKDTVIDSLKKLGIDKKASKQTQTKGHFGNIITITSATMNARHAMPIIAALRDALKWGSGQRAASEIESCISDDILYIRLDKQELVRGKILKVDEGAVRVRISKTMYSKEHAQDTYVDLFRV